MSKRKQGRRRFDAQREPDRGGLQASSAVPRDISGTLLFAATVFSGALLLFSVQPLIARYILPWFGGSPGVWATCMLFFQALLLAGYLYAHMVVGHLATRSQVVLHLILVAGSLAMIPIIPAAWWKPAASDDPSWQILLLLAATIGLPYLVLSATSPLLQAWFVRTRPSASPYRLFALSNFGSLLALLGYPLILEPLFTRRQQAWIWSIGLIVFAFVCATCAAHVWRRCQVDHAPATAAPAHSGGQQPAGTVLLWLALPMVASVLLLAITNTITEDVAGTPLLWVIPLALYLLTFVIAFDSPRWYPRRVVLFLLPLCTIWMIRIHSSLWVEVKVSLIEQFAAYLLGLFVLCLFCHGEVARRKPDPSRLTGYYLLIATGGALGGIFVALIAPRVFDRLVELPLGVLAAAALSFACFTGPSARHGAFNARLWLILFFVTALALALAEPLLKPWFEQGKKVVVDRSRNFYGTLVVADEAGDDGTIDHRRLYHGSIAHGFQYLTPERRFEPTLYYHQGTGVALAIRHAPRQDNRRIGLVGLGVGTLAAFGKPGDVFRFYEINPDVERMARQHFTFLADSAGKVDIILGDARLTLEREEPQQFDVLVLDAFSGDAIPTHLLTAEAFDIYLKHLAPNGIIAVHFSNRSVDLGPVLLRQAERIRMSCLVHDARPGWWMLMTSNRALVENPQVRSLMQLVVPSRQIPLWTDDSVNLIRSIWWVPQGISTR